MVEAPISAGAAASAAGDIGVVGAPNSGRYGPESGAAFIYRRLGGAWNYDGSLTAPGVTSGDHFGLAVATDGVSVAVGAPDDSGAAFDSGSARVFRHNGTHWVADPTVIAPGGATDDRFGAAVVISGDTLAVAAPGSDTATADAGAVMIFTRVGGAWIHAQTLTPPDADPGDRFGTSVAIDGNRMIIGAYADDEHGTDAGAAYIYERLGGVWQFDAKLTAEDAAPADLFGWSVALESDTAVVGAYGRDDAGSLSGAAYVFERQGQAWVAQGSLIGATASEFDRAGWSVAIDQGVVLVGSPRDDATALNAGGVTAFTRSNGVWTSAARIAPTASEQGAEFGAAVALTGGVALIGAPRSGSGVGRAFAAVALGDCDDSGVLDACEVITGALADADHDGVPDACLPPPCPGDATANGLVDVRDLNFVLAFWAQTPYPPFESADLDDDGFVDIDDLNIVLAGWGCVEAPR